jgi:hypothetical protein
MTIKQETAIKFQHQNTKNEESTFIQLLDHTRFAIPAEIYTDIEVAW